MSSDSINRNRNVTKTGSKDKEVVLYRMIYKDLKAKIVEGVYKPGDKLPVERDLCDLYSVDRITVRKALALLVDDGLLEKKAGLGSFVKQSISKILTEQNQSHNILFVMSRNSNEINSNPSAFNSQLFYAIEKECRLRGYSLFYSVLNEQGDLASLTNGNSFAGILFVSYVPKQILDQCYDINLPAICLNNRHSSLVSIVPEDEKGAYDAVKYLHAEGHKNIGILLGLANYYSTQERFRGFSNAMNELGLKINPQCILNGDWTFDGARNAMIHMLNTLDKTNYPTAIFCCSDIMALGAMDAVKEKQLSIPDDISIVGFDNVQQSNYVYPRLTTVSVDVQLMAELAMDRIYSYREKTGSRGYMILIPTTIEKRQSVKSIQKIEWR